MCQEIRNKSKTSRSVVAKAKMSRSVVANDSSTTLRAFFADVPILRCLFFLGWRFFGSNGSLRSDAPSVVTDFVPRRWWRPGWRRDTRRGWSSGPALMYCTEWNERPPKAALAQRGSDPWLTHASTQLPHTFPQTVGSAGVSSLNPLRAATPVVPRR